MKHYDPLAGVKPAWPYRALVANRLVASEPRPSSPRFYLWTPDFLQGCEIKSGQGRPGLEA